MPVTAEAAHLLGQIRDLRVRQRQRLAEDLETIDRDYDGDMNRLRRRRRKRANEGLLLAAVAPVVAWLIAIGISMFWA
jgi:hypothetical protein